MEELQVIDKNLTAAVDFEGMGKLTKELVPQMSESVNKAIDAMKKIGEITTDDQYKIANDLLVRVKLTYEKVNGKRRQITDPYDEFRKALMQYENALNPKKGADNEYNRIRGLLESFNQAKLDEKRKKEEELAKENLIKTRVIEFKAEIKKNLVSGPSDKLAEADATLDNWFGSITLDNFDKKQSSLNIKPNLKQELYDSWFKTSVDISIVPENLITEAAEEVKKEYPYEKINKQYQIDASVIIQKWKDKLPELKSRLEDIAKAEGEEKKKLEEQLAAKKKLEKEEAEKKAKEAKEEAERKIEAEAADEKTEAHFMHQGSVQNLDTNVKGTSKFVARFNQDAQENWLKPFVEVLYNVAIHEDFRASGIYQKDKDGDIKLDEKGREMYIPAIAWWMKFFGDKCNADIKGIKLFEDTKIQVRQTKQ